MSKIQPHHRYRSYISICFAVMMLISLSACSSVEYVSHSDLSVGLKKRFDSTQPFYSSYDATTFYTANKSKNLGGIRFNSVDPNTVEDHVFVLKHTKSTFMAEKRIDDIRERDDVATFFSFGYNKQSNSAGLGFRFEY